MNDTKLKSVNYHLTDVNFFEGNFPWFIAKLFFAFCVYVFVLDPIFYRGAEEIKYGFLNEHPYFYSLIIFFAALTAGYIHGKGKRSLFTVYDTLVILIIIYLRFLCISKYELLPKSSNLAFIYIVVVGPLFSYIVFICTNWKSIFKSFCQRKQNIKTSKVAEHDNITKIKLIPDLTLKGLVTNADGTFQDEDILGYHNLATEIFNAINSFTPPKAFSIGLNGAWGSGKSSLMEIITEELIPKFNSESSPYKIHVINFCPWLYPDDKSLIANFFLKWKEEIRDISMQIAFSDYSEVLTELEVSNLRFDPKVFLRSKKGLDEIKKGIEEYLGKPGHLYLVIIDDLDRLDKNEIIEVAKLSRVLANFPNTFYLLAYDRNYIDAVLQGSEKENEQGDNKNHTYFDKIVQLEFKIPQITETKLAQYLRAKIIDNSEFIITRDTFKQITLEEIERQVDIIANLKVYQHFLPTIRDINRLVNAFLLRYVSLRKEHTVGFKEILLLEIMFYKHKFWYEHFYKQRNDLVNKNLLVDNRTESINPFVKNAEDKKFLNTIITAVFEDLIPNKRLKLIDAYYSYFSSDIFTEADLQYFLRSTEPEKVIRTYFENGHRYSLIWFYIEYCIKTLKSPKINFEMAIGKKGKVQENFALFTKILTELNLTLTAENQYRLGNYIIYECGELGKLYHSVDSDIDKGRITEMINAIQNFLIPHELLNINTDGSNIKFEWKETPHKEKYETTDDCSFDKILDLVNHKYEIVVNLPEVPHWRFGFKFSQNTLLPAAAAFRHQEGYPLMHIGKDHGAGPDRDYENIKVTAYGKDPGEIKDNPIINNIAFITTKPIKLVLGYINDSPIMAIDDDNGKTTIIDNLNWKGFSKCMMQAWADNEPLNKNQKYSFEVKIKEIR